MPVPFILRWTVAQRKAFLLRIDPKLYDALAGWAAQDLRSLNAQIEFLLRRELERNGRLSKSDEPLAADPPNSDDRADD